MWVIFKETYIGGVGEFPKGHKIDVAPDILQYISEDFYEPCSSPEDEKRNGNITKLNALVVITEKAQAEVTLKQIEVDKAKKIADESNAKALEYDREIKSLQADIKKADPDKKATLKRIIERKELLFAMATASTAYYEADTSFHQMDLEDAQAEADRAQFELENSGKKTKLKKSLASTRQKITKLRGELSRLQSDFPAAEQNAEKAGKAHQEAAAAVKRAKKKTGVPGDGYLIADEPKLKQAAKDAKKAVGVLGKSFNKIKKELYDAEKLENKLSAELEKLCPPKPKDTGNAERQDDSTGQARQ